MNWVFEIILLKKSLFANSVSFHIFHIHLQETDDQTQMGLNNKAIYEVLCWAVLSCSVMSDSLQPHGL